MAIPITLTAMVLARQNNCVLYLWPTEHRTAEKEYKMKETDNLVVCMEKGAQRDAAAALARRVGASLSDKPSPQLTLQTRGRFFCLDSVK